MRGRWYVAGGVLAMLVVGACSNSSGDDAGGTAGLKPGANEVQPGVPDFDSQTAYGGAIVNASGRASGGSPPAGAPNGGKAAPLLLIDSGYKIRVARMTVAVKGAANIAAKADEAAGIALQAGGEVDSDNRTNGPHASASLLLRVPPDALTDTLTSLAKLGVEKSRSLSTSDVTQKVADVASRVQSAQRSIARLRVLFDHATKIADIIQLESELNSREAELESLQAQQRSLAQQTSMATVTLTLITATKSPAPPKPEDDDNGFVGGLKRGWDGFTGAAVWVAEALGTLLPFLVLLLVLGLGFRVLGMRMPRLPRRPAPAPAPSE